MPAAQCSIEIYDIKTYQIGSITRRFGTSWSDRHHSSGRYVQGEGADQGRDQPQQSEPIEPTREAARRILHDADVPRAEEATEVAD
jgi:hypothetical protein